MEPERKHPVYVILRQAGGYACLAVGVVGCILPVIPGVPLLFAGLGLLAADSPWAARLRDRLKKFVARRLMRQRSASRPEAQETARQ